VRIGFESEEEMREALTTEEYKKAHELRAAYMRETSVGIRSAVLDRRVQVGLGIVAAVLVTATR
jgi:hypothetical protein